MTRGYGSSAQSNVLASVTWVTRQISATSAHRHGRTGRSPDVQQATPPSLRGRRRANAGSRQTKSLNPNRTIGAPRVSVPAAAEQSLSSRKNPVGKSVFAPTVADFQTIQDGPSWPLSPRPVRRPIGSWAEIGAFRARRPSTRRARAYPGGQLSKTHLLAPYHCETAG